MVEPVYRRMPRARRPVTLPSHGPRRPSSPPGPETDDGRRQAVSAPLVSKRPHVRPAGHERSGRAHRRVHTVGCGPIRRTRRRYRRRRRVGIPYPTTRASPPSAARRRRRSDAPAHRASVAGRPAGRAARLCRIGGPRGGTVARPRRRDVRGLRFDPVRPRPGLDRIHGRRDGPVPRSTRRWWATAVREMPCSAAMTSASVPAECSPTASISTIRRRTGSARTENGWGIGCAMRRG